MRNMGDVAELDLDAIEARAAAADAEVGNLHGGTQQVIGLCVDDVPALVAEVRRLRQSPAMLDVCKAARRVWMSAIPDPDRPQRQMVSAAALEELRAVLDRVGEL